MGFVGLKYVSDSFNFEEERLIIIPITYNDFP